MALYIYLQNRLIYSQMEALVLVESRCLKKSEEARGVSCGWNTVHLSRKGSSRSWREEQGFQFFLKGDLVSM